MKWLIILTIIAILFVAGCATEIPEEPDITNFEECAAAGNPVMESYPRQCAANGQIFVEEVEVPVEPPEEPVEEVIEEEPMEIVTLYPGNCYEREGVPVKASDGCAMDETVVGAVEGFKIPYVCCIKSEKLCTPESREADVCAAIYEPVCGFHVGNGGKTYSNTCTACMNENVVYWAKNEC